MNFRMQTSKTLSPRLRKEANILDRAAADQRIEYRKVCRWCEQCCTSFTEDRALATLERIEGILRRLQELEMEAIDLATKHGGIAITYDHLGRETYGVPSCLLRTLNAFDGAHAGEEE